MKPLSELNPATAHLWDIGDRAGNDMAVAVAFGAILDSLCAPTSAVRWLERAAAQIRAERDPEKREKRNKIVIRIMARDGNDCWLCQKPLGDDVSLEHLTPLSRGGTWDDANLALAHRHCNRLMGDLTRPEKTKLRDDFRTTRSEGAPNKPPSVI